MENIADKYLVKKFQDKQPTNNVDNVDNKEEKESNSAKKIIEMEINKLISYRKQQPFSMYSESKRQEVKESIEKFGVLNPIIVRPVENGQYEIIAGHNRVEISKELGIPKEEIVMSLDAIQDPLSLQEPVYNDGTESIYIMDQVKDIKNTDESWAENITIAEAMKKLNDREKVIVNKRFFDGRTQMEVAEEIGISQAQVSRLEKSAIERIKKMYN